MALIDNLISYWKFDEASGNAYDSHGINHLTNGNLATFVAGKINNGMKVIRASSQSFYIPYAEQSGLAITGNISISVWIKITNQPSDNYYYICNKSDEWGNQRAFAYYYYDVGGVKHLRFVVGNDVGANDLYDINCSFPTGTWTHIVMTWQASNHTASFYQDGSLVTTSTGSVGLTAIDTSQWVFSIGAYYDSFDTPPSNGYHYADFQVDEFGIWSRVLTSTEVSTLYNAGSGYKYPLDGTSQSPSISPSASPSPSSSQSPSASPSASSSPSPSPSASQSPSSSQSPSASPSLSPSLSPSSSISPSSEGEQQNQVVKVAKIGKSVNSVDPNDFIFHSNYNTFKIILEGTKQITLLASTANQTFTQAHGFNSFVPLVSAFAKDTSLEQVFLPNGVNVDYFALKGGFDGDVKFNYVETDPTNMIFNFDNNDTSERTINIRYFLLEKV